MRLRLWTVPHTSATYSFSTSRSWNWRASSWWAASFLATTITPEVPLSSRCTMPGRDSPPMPLRSPHVVEQRVDERAGGVTGPGMHDQAGRLVDHHDVGVVVQDRQRQILGLQVPRPRPAERRRRRRRRGESPCSTLANGHAGQADAAVVDEALDLRPRVVGELAGEKLVEALSVVVGGDLEGEKVHGGGWGRQDPSIRPVYVTGGRLARLPPHLLNRERKPGIGAHRDDRRTVSPDDAFRPPSRREVRRSIPCLGMRNPVKAGATLAEAEVGRRRPALGAGWLVGGARPATTTSPG